MADSTYTTGKNVLMKWLQNLNSPNSSEQATSKSLDVEIVDVVPIMRALGMKLVSYEKSGEVLKTGSRVIIGSKNSGVKYVMEKSTSHCNCPIQNSESSFWSVSGIGSKETLTEADSSAFPKISSGLNELLHDTSLDILHVIREVELKPNKRRHIMIRSQLQQSPRLSPNVGGIRHAASMPIIYSATTLPESLKEMNQMRSEIKVPKIIYPEMLSVSSNEAVLKKFEYITGEIDTLLSVLKLNQSTSVNPGELNSLTSQFSEINIPKNCDPVENPKIDFTEAIVKKLDHIKEEMGQLKSIFVEQPLARTQVMQNVVTGNKKDSEYGNKGIIKKRHSPIPNRIPVMARSTAVTRSSFSSVRTPAKQGAVGINKPDSQIKGAINKRTPIYQRNSSLTPRTTSAAKTSLSAARKSKKQETVDTNGKVSEGECKGSMLERCKSIRPSLNMKGTPSSKAPIS